MVPLSFWKNIFVDPYNIILFLQEFFSRAKISFSPPVPGHVDPTAGWLAHAVPRPVEQARPPVIGRPRSQAGDHLADLLPLQRGGDPGGAGPADDPRGGEGQQREVAGSLDRQGHCTLMLGAVTRDAPRDYLATLGDEEPQAACVLVLDLQTLLVITDDNPLDLAAARVVDYLTQSHFQALC